MEDILEDWKRYERLVARLMADQLSTDFCVTPNASVLGVITGIKRQIDVLIEARHDTDMNRAGLIGGSMCGCPVSCKCHSRL